MRAAAITTGTRLGRYEIVRYLATGGMAEIYLARAVGIGAFERHAVLKVIAGERRGNAQFVRMFLDEARLAAGLHHANIAQVYDVGEADGEFFYAMEYVHGDTARALLEDCAQQQIEIPLELGLAVAIGAASGLHHAHEREGSDGRPLAIVHRDVSPSNLMVGYDGAIKVLDFGIARASERATETESGVVKGKYAYMAPEQCRAQPVDRRADVFALGIVLYELTTQHRAFKCDSDFETMSRIVHGELRRPSEVRPGYPPALEAIVLRAMALDRDARYQTAAELGDALEAFAESHGLALSQRAVARFMAQVYGVRPEPWRTHVAARPVDEVRPSMRLSAVTPSPLAHTPMSLTLAAPPRTDSRVLAAPPPRTDSAIAPAIELVAEPPRARTRPLWIGGAVVAVAAVIALVVTQGGGEERAAATAAAPTPKATAPVPVTDPDSVPDPDPDPDPDPVPDPDPDTDPVAVPDPVPAPGAPSTGSAPRVPPPPVATISVRLTSVPSGANVTVGGQSRGRTPVLLALPRGSGSITARLDIPGFVVASVVLGTDRDAARAVTLVKKPKAKRTGGGDGFSNPFAK